MIHHYKNAIEIGPENFVIVPASNPNDEPSVEIHPKANVVEIAKRHYKKQAARIKSH